MFKLTTAVSGTPTMAATEAPSRVALGQPQGQRQGQLH